MFKSYCKFNSCIIWYCIKKREGEILALVFKFGGRFLNISLLEIEGCSFKVKPIYGNSYLDGEDFSINIDGLLSSTVVWLLAKPAQVLQVLEPL